MKIEGGGINHLVVIVNAKAHGTNGGVPNDELGADGIAAAQATCDEQLAAIANPPQQSLPLPWG